MDRNQLTGILILTIGLTIYLHYFGPQKKQSNKIQTTQIKKKEIKKNYTLNKDLNYGIFDQFLKNEEKQKDLILENQNIKIFFNNKGAKITKVILKKYKNPQNQPLILYDNLNGSMAYNFKYKNSYTNLINDISTENLKFDYELQNNKIVFYLPFEDSKIFKRTYILDNNFGIQHNLELNGFDTEIIDKKIEFVWQNKLKILENDINKSLEKATINYYTTGFNSLKIKQKEIVEKTFTEPCKWISFKQRFFTSAIIFENSIKSKTDIKVAPNDSKLKTRYLKYGTIKFNIDLNENNNFNTRLFFGPNKYKILKKVNKGFENNLFLGWPIVRWINKFFTTPIFDFLSKYISNVGLIIIIFVVIIKIILLPLSFKSQISLSKMKVIKPELDEIKKKYKNDTRKIQMEQVNLYREMGINPLGGCIPIILQMPMLIAMFNFFPNAIEIRGASFLWVKDLSTYDSILTLPFTIPLYGDHVSLFTLLMTLSTIISTYTNKQMSSQSDDSMKYATYLMPIMFMFILNSFPAALSLYYFVSNMLTLLQQFILSRMINEKKLKEQLQKNKTNFVSKKTKLPRSQARLQKLKEDKKSK